jgi:hypothetical protein
MSQKSQIHVNSHLSHVHVPAIISLSPFFCTVSNPNPRLSLHSQQACRSHGSQHPHPHPNHLHHDHLRHSNSTNQNTTTHHQHHQYTHIPNPLHHHASNRNSNLAALSAATRISIHFHCLGANPNISKSLPSTPFHGNPNIAKPTLLLDRERRREREREN